MDAPAPKEYPVLWWTPNYGSDRYDNYLVNKCGLPYTCKMTMDRTKYNESPLVIFQQWSLRPEELPPKEDVRSGKKAWVLNSGM